MTTELDGIVRVGSIAVAAIAQRTVHRGFKKASWIHGAKQPVAILIRRHDVTTAFEPDGSSIALDDLEKRFPGRRAEFERAAVNSV